MGSSPFCDRLTVSVPRTHDAALEDVASLYGDQLAAVLLRPGYWLLPRGGSLLYSVRPLVATLEASGQAVQALRELGLWGNYLMALGELPHRVTRLDATLDVPRPAAPVLHALWARARNGGLRLSRKAIPATACGQLFRRPLYPGEALDTGTVYLPSARLSRADQYATVYDKRNERLDAGYDDPGPLVRYEARAARGMGATLSDAYEPTALFWHIMSPSILQAPPEAPRWSPATERFQVAPSPTLTPAERLQRFLDGPEGQALARLAAFNGGTSQVVAFLSRARAVSPLESAAVARRSLSA